jgi:hypothetical protein
MVPPRTDLRRGLSSESFIGVKRQKTACQFPENPVNDSASNRPSRLLRREARSPECHIQHLEPAAQRQQLAGCFEFCARLGEPFFESFIARLERQCSL